MLMRRNSYTYIHTDTDAFKPHLYVTKFFLSCFVWIVFIVLAGEMVLYREVLSVQWVITVHLGLGPKTSTRAQLDLSTLTRGWQHLRTACPALQVTHHLPLMSISFLKIK